jgi:parallel beta-helix repeat protein
MGNKDAGVFLYDYSSHNTVSGNNLTSNRDGIILGNAANDNIFFGNNVANDTHAGIRLWLSSNNIFSENSISKNGIGVFFDERELHGSASNLFFGNDIKENAYGVAFSWYRIRDNRICHNNFVRNTQQVVNGGRSTNLWDDGYPSGGNYWSDYNGTDLHSGYYQNETGSDGIGDTGYVIDGNNMDHYPLMGEFYDFNVTSEHHVQTVCNSSISDFHYNGTGISFDVTGDNGTSGFCRICIPTALMNTPFNVYVNGTEISYNLLPCSNQTYSYLYFNYSHSTERVIIIPEFPSFLILPLFMIATLLAVLICRRKRSVVKV